MAGFLLIAIYVGVSCLPVLLTLLDKPPPPKSFSIEYSAAIGYIAMSLMILQFAVAEKFKRIEKQFGLDIMLQFHKKIGIVLFFMLFAHPILIFVYNPELSSLLNPREMPLRTLLGILSLGCMCVLVLLSVFRERFKLSYETWKVTHGFLSVGVLLFALTHALAINRYLSLFWKGFIWDVFTAYVVLHLLYIRIIKPILMLKKPWKVKEITKEKGQSWSVTLEAVGHRGIHFAPGQFVYFRLKSAFIWYHEHPYTISSSAFCSHILTLTIKELGDFSREIPNTPIGSTAYIQGPYGVFSYRNFPEATRLWMFAGGIGITPMISMLRTLALEQDHKREVLLFYAAKKEEELTFYEEIRAIQKKIRLQTVFFTEEPSPHEDFENGYITKTLIEKYRDPDSETPQCFVCGPPIFNREIKRALRTLDLPYKNIHVELFQLV